MYYPFLRGKQFELIMLREMAPKISAWGFVPVIEPVKDQNNFPTLKKALDALMDNNCHFILIANPVVGDFKYDNSSLMTEIVNGQLSSYGNYLLGLNLTADDSLESARILFEKYKHIPLAIVHKGFSDGMGLATLIEDTSPNIKEHVFVEPDSTLYRKNFKNFNVERVIVKDGFQRRRNRDYPASEPFSELYLTYAELNCSGFGDFLIVGKEYIEGGGLAYAIAIHLIYKDESAQDTIAIKHYVSDRVDTRGDPAGKFLEALNKLAADVNATPSQIHPTKAVKEFLKFHENKHYPGLGYVKKLSMQHHMELMGKLVDKGA